MMICSDMTSCYSSGTLTSRIVWTLLIEVLVFVATIILAMVDSSDWPALFFYLTFACVVILNSQLASYFILILNFF